MKTRLYTMRCRRCQRKVVEHSKAVKCKCGARDWFVMGKKHIVPAGLEALSK